MCIRDRLNGAQLKNCDLSGANLEGADFFGAKIEGASFKDSIPVSYTHLDVYKRQQ